MARTIRAGIATTAGDPSTIELGWTTAHASATTKTSAMLKSIVPRDGTESSCFLGKIGPLTEHKKHYRTLRAASRKTGFNPSLVLILQSWRKHSPLTTMRQNGTD